MSATNAKLTNLPQNTEIQQTSATKTTPTKARSEICIEMIKKTKKQEPKIFPGLMLVDKEAFESGDGGHTRFIMKQFWASANNKILVARKEDTQAIVGYAIISVSDPKDPRVGANKRVQQVYLLRIGVRVNSQRQGIGRKLMNYILANYPEHPITLDVSTDNEKAVGFYLSCGFRVREIYLSCPDNVEFALFETPIDKKGKKMNLKEQENWRELAVQNYFEGVGDFKNKQFEQVEQIETYEEKQSKHQITETQVLEQKTEIPEQVVEIAPLKTEEEKAESDKGSEDTKSSNNEETLDKENDNVKQVVVEQKPVITEQPKLKLGNAFVPTFFKKPLKDLEIFKPQELSQAPKQISA